MTELAGWISGLAFGLSALPQVLKTYRTKSVDDLADGMVILWIIGEIAGVIYALGFETLPYPLLANYLFNAVGVSYLGWMKWHTKNNTAKRGSTLPKQSADF